MYLIKSNRRRNKCTYQKGIYYKKSGIPDFILCKIKGRIVHVDNTSEFYAMVSQKQSIQEAMELRALNKVLSDLIPYYESNHKSK